MHNNNSKHLLSLYQNAWRVVNALDTVSIIFTKILLLLCLFFMSKEIEA